MKNLSKINIMLVSILLLVFLANGCNKSDSKSNLKAIIPNPDKITLYDGGKTIEVKKDDKNFEKIINLTNDRINAKKLSTAKDIIDDKVMDGKKKIVVAVEFIYDKEQELNVKGDGFNPIKYNKLFFELSNPLSSVKPGGVENTAFQYGDLNHYKDSSRGPIKEPKELIDIVESFFK